MNYTRSKILVLVIVACLMLSTFNLGGMIVSALPDADTANVTLDVANATPANVVVGDIFQVTVNLGSVSSGLFYSADVAVYFDPAKLQVVKTDGTATTSPALGLIKEISTDFGAAGAVIDNTNGFVRYAVFLQPDATDPDSGSLYNEIGYPIGNGTFEMVTIRFKALATDCDTKVQIAKEGSAPAFMEGFGDGVMGYFGSKTVLATVNYTKVPLILGTLPADFTALDAAISTATAHKDDYTVGSAAGNVPQAAKTAFQAAITAATQVRNSVKPSQAQVDAAVSALATATTTYDAAVIQPASAQDKVALETAIEDATALITNTLVGTDDGNVSQDTQDDFQAVIDAAIVVFENASALKSEVDAQIAAIATATTIFQNNIVQPGIFLKKVNDANFSMVFATIELATAYVVAQNDAAKGDNSAVAVNYYAVSTKASVPVANRNLSLGKIVVSEELLSATIPDGAVIWVSTNSSGIAKVESTDYFTKGVNAFATLLEGYNAAPIGCEIVVKDGSYDASFTISKKVIIRSGSSPTITGDMIFAAAAAGSTIEGITFVAALGDAPATITVNSPDITIANLDLHNCQLIVNAADVALQNVTVSTPPTAGSVITLNAGANNTTISGFAYTENVFDAGAAINVAAGVTGTSVSDSVITNSASTILFGGVDASNVVQTETIYESFPPTPVTISNTGTETNVVLNIRKIELNDGRKRAMVYLTGIDTDQDIDSGHAVIGYSFKSLNYASVAAQVTANSNYTIVSENKSNEDVGILEIAYSRKDGVAPGRPTVVDINGVATPVLDLFELTFDLPAAISVGDSFSIWLSKNSPKNKILRLVERLVPNPVPGADPTDTHFILLPIVYTISSEYIIETVTGLTLTVHIQLPWEVKNNLTFAQQQFLVSILDQNGVGNTENYEIYDGAAADPYGTHDGATLEAVINPANGYVTEYILTLPGYAPSKQYQVTIRGAGYHDVARNITMNTDLAVYVWNNIRTIDGSNFLAGDLSSVTNEAGKLEVVTNLDFITMCGQYDTDASAVNKVVYDINRDQIVDLMDITYLLGNMKTFRTNYLDANAGVVQQP